VRQSVNKPKYFKEILYIVDEPKAEISGLWLSVIQLKFFNYALC
jgi:hypothetical protein